MHNCSVSARPSKAPTVVGQRHLPIPVHGRLGQLGGRHLEDSQTLHEAPNAYQLAPERTVVQKESMSVYQHNHLGARTAPTKDKKVVPNLGDKRRMSLDMRLKKIHRPSALRRASRWSPLSSGRKPSRTFKKTCSSS